MRKKKKPDEPRKLEWVELDYMGLPRRLWRMSAARIPESVQAPYRRFLKGLWEHMEKGPTLLLSGPQGVGKSAMASLACRRARTFDKTVHFFRVWELRHLRREGEKFDTEQTLLARCRDVELLVLDDVTQEDLDDRYYGGSEMLSLVKQRSMNMGTTLLTTRLGLRSEFAKQLKGAADCFLAFNVIGPDMSEALAREIKGDVVGGGN